MSKRKSNLSTTHRNLIIRPCTGQPVAVVFLNRLDLDDLRRILSERDLDLDKRLKRLYEGIAKESEIAIEKEGTK